LAKKPAGRAAARPAKKAGKKVAERGGRGAGGGAGLPPGMSPVTTGRGASPLELGQRLVAMFNSGKAHDVENELWAPSIVSVEGHGANMQWSGIKAVRSKNTEWDKRNEVLGGAAEGPYVGSTGFAVKFTIHLRDRASGNETRMTEVGVYTVQNGKIVREEFMYLMA
jgi:hypothetical protein